MPKTEGAVDAGETYAQLIAERKERRAALVRGAELVDERERLLELKERVYASLTENFDLTDVEACPNKRGALVQQGSSLLNAHVKLMGLCDQRKTGDQSAKAPKEQGGEPASAERRPDAGSSSLWCKDTLGQTLPGSSHYIFYAPNAWRKRLGRAAG